MLEASLSAFLFFLFFPLLPGRMRQAVSKQQEMSLRERERERERLFPSLHPFLCLSRGGGGGWKVGNHERKGLGYPKMLSGFFPPSSLFSSLFFVCLEKLLFLLLTFSVKRFSELFCFARQTTKTDIITTFPLTESFFLTFLPPLSSKQSYI